MVGRQPKHARPATMAGITIDSKVLVPTALAGAAGQVGPGAGQVCGTGTPTPPGARVASDHSASQSVCSWTPGLFQRQN